MSQERPYLHRAPGLDKPYVSLADGAVIIDPYFRNVATEELMLSLSPLEFDTFYAVARRCGAVASWATISAEVRPGEGLVRTDLTRLIFRIRQKLGPLLGDNLLGALRTSQHGGYYTVSSLSESPR